ncbi:hypothetical protein MKJ04_14645 [Pontibacter sp. E15-1]|uniref:hypothetical protein n=1 Tax=Pontibacter sp. E15-1 TaxID=2919918 RepID=UPI001F50262D|nr:hypothetical protein [Pontibacter sp. E15-1]MCJ8166083.1 hypothetical protein [Pontibacter sp. E15-1]
MKVGENKMIGKGVKPLLSLALLLLAALPGYGQISFDAREKHEQKMRKSLKEAEQVEYTYKETHLNTSAYTFKKGAAARKRRKQDRRATYQFDENGKPARKILFFKKRKLRQSKKIN